MQWIIEKDIQTAFIAVHEKRIRVSICVGWTPYSAAISLAVFCPLIASKATFVFRLALYRFRYTDIVFLLLASSFSIQSFYLIDLSSFLVPLYYLRRDGLRRMNKTHLAVLQHTILTGTREVMLCGVCKDLQKPRKTHALGQCHFCAMPVCEEHHVANGLEVHLCIDCYGQIRMMFPGSINSALCQEQATVC